MGQAKIEVKFAERLRSNILATGSNLSGSAPETKARAMTSNRNPPVASQRVWTERLSGGGLGRLFGFPWLATLTFGARYVVIADLPIEGSLADLQEIGGFFSISASHF